MSGPDEADGATSSQPQAESKAEDESPALPVAVKLTSKVVISYDSTGRKMVNEYVRERVLGHGSYAKVVLGKSTVDGKQYACKVCVKSRLSRVRVGPDRTALMDVRQEISVLEKLHHPHIVRMVEVIDEPDWDKIYIVIEYMAGGVLLDGTGRRGGISEAVARHIFVQVHSGLSYMHSQRVVHGDLKGENVLLSAPLSEELPPTCVAKISDFGLSHEFEGDDDWMRRSPGTPVFSSPESCSGHAYRGRLQDVWALGCLLYVLTIGEYPFRGTTLASTYEMIVKQPLRLPDTISSQLRDLLTKLLKKDPNSRIKLEQVRRHPWVEGRTSRESPQRNALTTMFARMLPASKTK